MLEAIYDNLVPKYDGLYEDLAHKVEDQILYDKIRPMIKGKILDVGCGTGEAIKGLDLKVEDYLGLDPSKGMISGLEQKFPGYRTITLAFEDYQTLDRFDTIISLYGSASYVPPSSYPKFKDLLTPGGWFYIMVLNPGYFPTYYTNKEKEMVSNNIDYKALDNLGVKSHFTNYTVISYENI